MKRNLSDPKVLAEIQWNISVGYWLTNVSLTKLFKQEGISHKLGNSLLLTRLETESLPLTAREWVEKR